MRRYGGAPAAVAMRDSDKAAAGILNMARIIIIWLTLLAFVGFARGAELYPNDPFRDSGPAILEHILAAKQIPAGNYWANDFVIPSGINGALIGVGMADQSRVWTAYVGNAVTVIHDMDGEGTLITNRRANVRFENATLSGKAQWTPTTPAGLGTLLKHEQKHYSPTVKAPPLGSCSYQNFSFLDAEVGIEHAPGDHCDHMRGNVMQNNVNYPLIVNENQSVDNKLDMTLKGAGKYAVWFKDGGRSQIRINTTGPWDAWLVVGDPDRQTAPNQNNGRIDVEVWADNGDHVRWPLKQLYAHRDPLPIINVTGFAADNVNIGSPEVIRGKITVRIERAKKTPLIWEMK